MIDSTTKKQVIAIPKDNYISMKIYSWNDLPKLEDYLEDKFQMRIESFNPIKDSKGNEIGSELFYSTIHTIKIVQDTIDEIE